MSSLKNILSRLNEDTEYQTSVEVWDFGRPNWIDKEATLKHGLKIPINWNLSINQKKWGISGMSPSVPDQMIKLIYEEPQEDGEEIEREIQWEILDAEVEVGCDGEVKFMSFQPVEIQIDFNKKTTKVIFKAG